MNTKAYLSIAACPLSPAEAGREHYNIKCEMSDVFQKLLEAESAHGRLASGMHLLSSRLSSQELNLLLQPVYDITLPAHYLLVGAQLDFKQVQLILHQVKAASFLPDKRISMQETRHPSISIKA